MNEKVSYLNVFFQDAKDSVALPPSREFADLLPFLIFLYNADSGTVEFGNRKFTDFAGSRALNPGKSDGLAGLMHPDDARRVWRKIKVVRTQDGRPIGSLRVRLSNGVGNYYFHDLQANILRWNESGEPLLVLFIAQDITDDLKNQEEIETTRELMEETEELLQFGSWAWDISTNTVTWTSGLYSLLGYTRQEVAGRTGFDFYLSHLLEEYAAPFREVVENALKEKRDFDYEYVLKTRTGVLKNISTRGRIVKDENDEVTKILCINRDITAIRSFEKEQERNIRELNRSNKDLEEFAYIASHDLQEPLRKISMFTERLKAKCDQSLDKEGELFIERILIAASNMRTLIDNLLDFSRANRRTHTFDEVNIKTILEAVISELELNIEETKATIHLAGTFPTVEAVTSEMKQVFSNILSNAIKFRKAQVPVRISVISSKLGKNEKHVLGLPQNGNFHRIEVQDNGIGFEPEYSEKIFQIFQRLNGKSEYPGSGIGLAICKKIVEKHNGLIFATSQPDQGSTFTVILPEKQF